MSINPEAATDIITMKWILDWIVVNPAVTITTIATVFIAVSAVVTVFLTRALVRDNNLLRKAGTEPEVIAYLVPHPVYSLPLIFVLANVGRGPARNVSFRLDANTEDLEIHNVILRNSVDRTAINFLPQGESIRAFFGMSMDVMKEPRLQPFDVVVKYQNMAGRDLSKTCPLDVAQFEGFELIESPEKKVADALEKIESHLRRFLVSSAGR